MSLYKEPIVIVGAGPAGATAARALALAGAAVRLLDRAAFPRNKPCGGGISARAVPRFPYLRDRLPEIATHYVSRLYLEGPDGESTVIESDIPAAIMIRRVEFDAMLVRLAAEAGAELVSGIEVVQTAQDPGGVTLTARDGRRFTAPVVIAADGVHSVVSRRLGLNAGWASTSVALDMMEETPRSHLRDVDPSTLWVAYGFEAGNAAPARRATRGRHDARRVQEGYAYIFPKRDHVNIGLGCVLAGYRDRIERVRPYQLQRDFVRLLRQRGIVEGESVRENFTPFLIPVGGPLRRPGAGRVLLAGDAGGFVNGFTAEGIYYAMVSGELAARAVVESAGDPSSMARRYFQACDAEIGGELRDSVIIRRYLFANRDRIAKVISGAEREAWMTRLILDFAIGRLTYPQLRWRILAAKPALAARFAWERVRMRKSVQSS